MFNESRMRRLVKACPYLEEIHFDSEISTWLQLEEDHDDGELRRMLEAARGKLRSIFLCGVIHGDPYVGRCQSLLEVLDIRCVAWICCSFAAVDLAMTHAGEA